jgi:cell division protein ZapA (FtsZ GTPase activity inhibitor)
VSDAAKALEGVRVELQLVSRRANELQSDFEICDDINLAVITALNMLAVIEFEVTDTGRKVVAA